MLKRFALMIAATAALTVPAASSFAAPSPQADGILPEQACHTAYPAHTQPLLCGRGAGGPGSGG
jgi:hypothetical protein